MTRPAALPHSLRDPSASPHPQSDLLGRRTHSMRTPPGFPHNPALHANSYTLLPHSLPTQATDPNPYATFTVTSPSGTPASALTLVPDASSLPQAADPTHYATYMSSRPPTFERDAIATLIQLLDADASPAAPGFRVHIAHLADAGALDMIKVRFDPRCVRMHRCVRLYGTLNAITARCDVCCWLDDGHGRLRGARAR